MAADLRHRCSMLFINVCGAKKARQGALLHRAIGPLKLVSSARPEAPRQGSDAQFVIVLHEDCGACFAALSRGKDALRLNTTDPLELPAANCWTGY